MILTPEQAEQELISNHKHYDEFLFELIDHNRLAQVEDWELANKYFQDTYDFLEFMGYPELVNTFQVADVARSVGLTTNKFWRTGFSPRFTALFIYGQTWASQIIPSVKNETKH